MMNPWDSSITTSVCSGGMWNLSVLGTCKPEGFLSGMPRKVFWRTVLSRKVCEMGGQNWSDKLEFSRDQEITLCLLRSLDIETSVSLVAENGSFPGKPAYFSSPSPLRTAVWKSESLLWAVRHLMFSAFSERLVRSILGPYKVRGKYTLCSFSLNLQLRQFIWLGDGW